MSPLFFYICIRTKTYDTMKADEKTSDTERITVDVSIEIVDKDNTPKVKYSNPWSAVAVWSLLAMIVSLFASGVVSIFISAAVCIISYVTFLISVSLSHDKIWDRKCHPWKYKD